MDCTSALHSLENKSFLTVAIEIFTLLVFMTLHTRKYMRFSNEVSQNGIYALLDTFFRIGHRLNPKDWCSIEPLEPWLIMLLNGLHKRGEIWWFSFQSGGRQIRESSRSKSKRVAEKLLAIRKAEVIEGRWNLPRSNCPRFDRWAEQFLSQVPVDSTRERYSTSINALKRYFRNVKLTEITEQSIRGFQQKRLSDGIRPATVNRDRAVLSRMLNLACKQRFISTNPCAGVEPLNEKLQRRQAKPFNDAEEKLILTHATGYLRLLFILLVETGLRPKREALRLRWSEVDLDAAEPTIAVVSSKTRAGQRKILLTDFCRNELRAWRELQSGVSEYVFPNPTNPSRHIEDYKTAWRTLTDQLGMQDRWLYDCRATFATRAKASGQTDLTVAQLLGHERTDIIPTYAKLVDENTRAIVRALNLRRLSCAQTIQ